MKARPALALATSGLFLCCVGNAFANDATEIPLNFDTQLIQIFETALKPVKNTPSPDPAFAPSGDDEMNAMNRILAKLRGHKMMLKNAVYRTDMGVIRLTWADDSNEDVVKAAYKTGKDPVLGNSLYADKRQVISIKIMYRSKSGDYEYVHVVNKDINDTPAAPVPDRQNYHYTFEPHPSNEQCRFCHGLAQNDGSAKGIFFPRYQEASPHRSGNLLSIQSGLLFRSEHFVRKPAAEAAKLGLPNMQEDFLYQKLMMNSADDGKSADLGERTRFFRALIELPQLVEVMARDNKQSTCVATDFGEDTERSGFGHNDYVCADNKAERLYVRLTNARLTVNTGAKEYSEPYFVKY